MAVAVSVTVVLLVARALAMAVVVVIAWVVALVPLRSHGCGVDDSGWPWMTVVCAFLLVVGGGGKGGWWWWWLRMQGRCWSGCDLLL